MENTEKGEQNYESSPIPSPSPTIIVTPEENGKNKQQNCDANNFTTRGTQWFAADTREAMLLKDHTYCYVPPWNPLPDTLPSPVAKQPATSPPRKSSAKPPPTSFDLDEDITDFTFSSMDDDGKDSSYQLSFEELDDTIESVVDNSGHDQDEMDKFKKMCSVPKDIVFQDELLQLFKRCAICGEDVLEKDLVKKGSALKVTTLCKNSYSKEWVSQLNVKRAATGNLLLCGAILFRGNTFSRVSELASTVNLAFPSEPDYFNWQKNHLFPVINARWLQEKA